MINFFNEANNIKDELIRIRRDIHKHPELGFEEERTSKLIKDFLTNEKIPYIETAITGICAVIKGELKGKEKVIALRADMDALPLKEKNDISYKSIYEGKMHACGHDGHVAILLGAAKILNSHKSEFSGMVKLFFEPAEETIGGAPIMIEDGVLEDPKVDMVVGLHVNEDVETGKIMVKSGPVNAASNPFKIKIKGKGGHGACPDSTHDPIVTAASIVNELQKIVSREIHPTNPAVITVATIHSGTAKNIISDEAEISGIIRTVNSYDRTFAKKRLKEIAYGICKINRCEAEIIIDEGYPNLINNEEVVNRVINAAKEVIGEENIKEQKEPSMGVESFAYFALERPSAFYYLGTGNKLKGTDKPAHGNYFNIDEDALKVGVGIQCTICYEYLTSN
ncbi:MAG: amidohydrolase [Clostridium sp.]|uniref:M20 metallopeptidase family protein n=1 Tax=Clostridium sp. DSM 8431 TaxID=1761781 RepID=UPI0008EEBAD0|nr:M20 family metallopeptidase [Clostridium sp. DSM 8431]MCR4943062.1 amidohydrolase [Clostridium sp.]SFU43250.1 amidohydrolase [Clostridium sp. DSM 8431]